MFGKKKHLDLNDPWGQQNVLVPNDAYGMYNSFETIVDCSGQSLTFGQFACVQAIQPNISLGKVGEGSP